MPSFDIVSTFNIQEVDNAINITAREVMTRYDLKDQQCKIQLNKHEKDIILEDTQIIDPLIPDPTLYVPDYGSAIAIGKDVVNIPQQQLTKHSREKHGKCQSNNVIRHGRYVFFTTRFSIVDVVLHLLFSLSLLVYSYSILDVHLDCHCKIPV